MRFLTTAVGALACALSLSASVNSPQSAIPPAGTTAPAAGTPAAGSVTVPLAQFEELRTATASASATVVNLMTISGTFAAKNVAVTFEGRSVGARTATTVITDAPDLTLSGCTGEALVTRAGKGVYDLIALAPSFSLRCEARPSGSDRVRMNVSPSVLAVRSTVADGELVTGDEDSSGARTYTLVRQVAGSGETLATTATGRYLITLLPDTSRFRYVIQVHNPNRSTSPLPLEFHSGEHLQQIESAATYEPSGARYVFAMPPGDSTITLSGELQGTSFVPPVAASLQYVVVESHPLLRPAIGGSPKRVSAGETGIATEYRGALAFEVGPREKLSWSVTRLEAMRAISYAIRNTTHTFFIPASGPVLGESSISLDNQGAPELILPPRPEPTFVSLGDEAVLMTKNARGELTVPLSAGEQVVTVQHRQPMPALPIAVTTLDVPRLPVPATHTNVELRYPRHWLPLWQSFATQTQTWMPDAGSCFMLLLFVLWLERVLLFAGMRSRRRIAAALLLGFAAMNVPLVLWLVVAGCAFVTAVWIASLRLKLSLPRLAGAVALALAVVVIAGIYTLSTRVGSSDSDSYTSVERQPAPAAAKVAVTDTAEITETTATTPAAPGAAAPPRAAEALAYQGLPAKFELPSGARSESFHEPMLSPDRPQRITLVLLSMSLVTWTCAALAALAAWLVWRERASIKTTLRARMAAALPPAAEVA